MMQKRITPTQQPAVRHGAGFTLVELLIVVAILLLLALMSASVINLSINNDKVRAGARQVQSYLAGARDRAIYAKAPRGVRFLLDPTNNRTVSSMVFIQATDPWALGTVILERLDLDNDGNADQYNAVSMPNPPALVLRGFDNDPNNPYAIPTTWTDLVAEGLLTNGTRVQIGPSKIWYTVTIDLLANASPPGTPAPNYYPPRLRLTTAYGDSLDLTNGSVTAASGPMQYALELPPSVIPGSEAVQMPKGTVIHLDRCTSVGNLEQTAAAAYPNRGDKLPSAWKQTPSITQSFTGAVDPTNFDYTPMMDILFSPRGVVTGPAAQRGIIHLYIADQKDADRDRLVYWNTSNYPTQSTPEYGALADGIERGDKVILSLFTRTGAVSTHSVFSNLDPFRYAETGQVAGK